MSEGQSRVVLHIGYPKTGTSTLQKFLYANRERLSERGILYPREADLVGSQHGLAQSFTLGYRPGPRGLTFAKVGDQIRDSEEDVFVLSSEQWVVQGDQTAAALGVERFAEEADVSVDVIVFVRPQHAFINSLYTQLAKRFHKQGMLADYAQESVERPLLDYSAHLGAWDRSPRMRLVPIPFTGGRLKPNLETAFFDAAGLSDRVDELLENRGPRANAASGPLAVEVCRRVAIYLGQLKDDAADQRALGRLSRAVLRLSKDRMSWDQTPFNGLDNDLRDRIDARFYKSNQAFARRYWNTDWYDIFPREYERDLTPNEFGGSRTSPRDRRAVDRTTRIALQRTDRVLGRSAQSRSRRRETPRARAESATD